MFAATGGGYTQNPSGFFVDTKAADNQENRDRARIEEIRRREQDWFAKATRGNTAYGQRRYAEEAALHQRNLDVAAEAEQAYNAYWEKRNKEHEFSWAEFGTRAAIMTAGAVAGLFTAGAGLGAAEAAGNAAFNVGSAVLPQVAIDGIGALAAMSLPELAIAGTAVYAGGKAISGASGEQIKMSQASVDLSDSQGNLANSNEVKSAISLPAVSGGGGLSLAGSFGDFWGDIKGAIERPGVPAARHDDSILFEGMV